MANMITVRQLKEMKQYEQRTARAEAKGKDVEDVRPAKFIAPLAKSNDTTLGKAVYVSRTTVEILDQSLIPLDVPEYWEVTRKPVKSAIKAALQAGKVVPGCQLVTSEIQQVRG